jgi:hypothetical protein
MTEILMSPAFYHRAAEPRPERVLEFADRMNLAFLVPRKGYLKVLGALVDATLARGHRATLLWDPVEPKRGEAVGAEDLAAWPTAAVQQWDRREPLLPVLRAAGVDAVVGNRIVDVLSASGHGAELAALQPAGIRLFSVDYLFDTITSHPSAYRLVDTTFYLSEYERSLHWRVAADGFTELGEPATWRRRSAVCGSTTMDQLALVDAAAVRRRYGLAPDRPVVVFMSLKMAVPEVWRRAVWGPEPRLVRAARAALSGHPGWIPTILRRHGYRSLVESVQRFCRRSGAVLVVKSKEKNDDPPFLRTLADVWLYDERVYPYTSMELLAIASLCIHFQSGAALEAAFAGVPSLSLTVPQSHLAGYATFEEIYGGRPGTIQNFPGVVWTSPAAEAAARLDIADLGSFRLDPAARRSYVQTFLGFDDTASSARVLDEIERVSAVAL